MFVLRKDSFAASHTHLSQYFIERLVQQVDFNELVSNRHRTVNGYLLIREIEQLCRLTLMRPRTIYRLQQALLEAQNTNLRSGLRNDYILTQFCGDIVRYYEGLEVQRLRENDLAAVNRLLHRTDVNMIRLAFDYPTHIRDEFAQIDFTTDQVERNCLLIDRLLDCLVPYLLYVGRLHPVKALDRLIGALARSRAFMTSGFVLKIAGDDRHGYRKTLEDLARQLGISEKVHFLGHVEGAEKQQLYADAYFSILPSHTENFGNVVIESLAQRTPVIASWGTPWETLQECRAGFWVENSVTMLASTLDRSIDLSAEDYLTFREKAHDLALKNFDIFENIHSWIYLYQTTSIKE